MFRIRKRRQNTSQQYIFHHLQNVKALDNYILEVQFKSGEIKLYDVKPLIERYHMFRVFHDNAEMFGNFKVDDYALVWNDQVDLHCNELWNNGFNMDN